ncbi:hypothetical protein SISNIDRAFT_187972 [Sistotremastrum niveocremeum HHB9708]|uniref:Uncharacterized protein n=1 Tax=Sistotremastrum niveocremeum HHB9708 TaxID=1314777 RepID=A0A164Z3D9_9AGAM|nr:hypothetical protein SISNIDRAFT_187972 [Sistotremastrum niveocremeum HHB9708]
MDPTLMFLTAAISVAVPHGRASLICPPFSLCLRRERHHLFVQNHIQTQLCPLLSIVTSIKGAWGGSSTGPEFVDRVAWVSV